MPDQSKNVVKDNGAQTAQCGGPASPVGPAPGQPQGQQQGQLRDQKLCSPSIARQAADNCAAKAQQYDLRRSNNQAEPNSSNTSASASKTQMPRADSPLTERMTEMDKTAAMDEAAMVQSSIAALAAAAAVVLANAATTEPKPPAALGKTAVAGSVPPPEQTSDTDVSIDHASAPNSSRPAQASVPASDPIRAPTPAPAPSPAPLRITSAQLPKGLATSLPAPPQGKLAGAVEPTTNQPSSDQAAVLASERLPTTAPELKLITLRFPGPRKAKATAITAGPVFDPAQPPATPSQASPTVSEKSVTAPTSEILTAPAVKVPPPTDSPMASPIAAATVAAETTATRTDIEAVVPQVRPAKSKPLRLPPSSLTQGKSPDKPAIKKQKSWPRRVIRAATYAAAGYGLLCMFLLGLYRFVDPPTSNLMLWQRLKGIDVQHVWVPLKDISPNVIRAVIASEDAKFCRHHGVDLGAIRYALRHAKKGPPRGASTISMQVSKNLFLWNSKSYIRKAIEIPLTLLMELMWPKSRILEIYLNIAEWGDGIFGIEAAAEYHFGKSARQLTLRQASLLAASLPNPRRREAGAADRRTRILASRIAKRASARGNRTACVLAKGLKSKPRRSR